MEGAPKFPVTRALPAFPYSAYAELLGLKSLRLDRPADVHRVRDEALAADRPVVVEAVTDPNLPPLPPPAHRGAAE